MATTMKKGRPADKGKKKAVATAKDRIKSEAKAEEEVCYSTETAVAERTCCCEDLCC